MAKVWFIGFFFLIGCENRKAVSIRKIPCNELRYFNEGNLRGNYLTKYYAVNFSDSVPVELLKNSADTILRNTDTTNLTQFSIHFMEESDLLKKIRSCEITDSHNLVSSQHTTLRTISYFPPKNLFEVTIKEVERNGSVDKILNYLPVLLVFTFLSVIGYYCLFKPAKARDYFLRWNAFLLRKIRFQGDPFGLLMKPWYLWYLRIMGLILLLVGSLFLILFIGKK